MNTITKLAAKQCSNCGAISLEPADSCCRCGSVELGEAELSGAGTLYSFTIVHVGFGHMADKVPYLLGVVQLEEGIFVTTVIEDVDLDQVEVGMHVRYKHHEEQIGYIFSGETG